MGIRDMNMEQILQKLLAEAPNMGVLLIVIYLFLKAQEKRDSFIKQLHDEHIEARKESKDAIKENTVATIELTRTFKTRNH